MKIVLMGNPNVGKSALFSRLTGIQVICSNYPGTTVSYCSGKMIYGGFQVEVVDVPGTYSLGSKGKVERIAAEMMHEGGVVVNVVDATNLERNLFLTLQIMESGKPIIVALNMWDDTKHRGVEINVKKLEEALGVPVVPTVAVTGEGVKELVDRLPEARRGHLKRKTERERWIEIGEIVDKCQKLVPRQHTLLEKLEDASISPVTGLPLAAIILLLTFMLVVDAGNFIITHILDPFFYGIYGPFVRGVVESIAPSGLVHDLLLGTTHDFISSLGVLTTGVYVEFDMVLPFVVLFYLALGFLEDVGYLPRLATLMDTLMHRLGLHGSAIVPTILGLGCNVPGMLSTRIMDSRKQRFIAATLLAICVPCAAKNAVIVGLLMRYGVQYVLIVYAALAILYVALGLILNRIVPGEVPEILLEVPPYRVPDLRMLLKKIWFRVRYFLTDATPYVLLGVLAVNLMHVFGIIRAVEGALGPLFSALFGLPSEAVAALVVGFLRKDVAVGMLAPLGLSPMQLTVACTILATYFPCVATYTMLLRELGLKDALKATGIMILAAILVGVLMHALLL